MSHASLVHIIPFSTVEDARHIPMNKNPVYNMTSSAGRKCNMCTQLTVCITKLKACSQSLKTQAWQGITVRIYSRAFNTCSQYVL